MQWPLFQPSMRRPPLTFPLALIGRWVAKDSDWLCGKWRPLCLARELLVALRWKNTLGKINSLNSAIDQRSRRILAYLNQEPLVFLRWPVGALMSAPGPCREDCAHWAEMEPRCVKPRRLFVCWLWSETAHRVQTQGDNVAYCIVAVLLNQHGVMFGMLFLPVGQTWDKHFRGRALIWKVFYDLSQINNRLLNKQWFSDDGSVVWIYR